jgi:hypothetical protein
VLSEDVADLMVVLFDPVDLWRKGIDEASLEQEEEIFYLGVHQIGLYLMQFVGLFESLLVVVV